MPHAPVLITDPDDPRLEAYTKIRERDLVGRDGMFVAEGEVVVRVLAARGRFAIRSLLLEERRVAAIEDVLATLPDDVPIYVVPQAVMDAVAGFSIHRGILALGARGRPLAIEELLARATLVVGLVGITNHDNVGGIFRNAAAFGASCVLYDHATCDPLYRKAIRVSVGASLFVPFVRVPTASAMLDALASARIEPIALTPNTSTLLDALDRRPRALLLGTEGEGLPADVLARARPVRIDIAPGFDSLNVAVTSGIALYEATRARR